MTPGRGSSRAMWVNREYPKYREIYKSLPHDTVWRTTGEMFELAQKSGLVRVGDNMGSLIASMRKHYLAESLPAEGNATPAPKPGAVKQANLVGLKCTDRLPFASEAVRSELT